MATLAPVGKSQGLLGSSCLGPGSCPPEHRSHLSQPLPNALGLWSQVVSGIVSAFTPSTVHMTLDMVLDLWEAVIPSNQAYGLEYWEGWKVVI